MPRLKITKWFTTPLQKRVSKNLQIAMSTIDNRRSTS